MAECVRLESVYGRNVIGGSNPPFSAKNMIIKKSKTNIEYFGKMMIKLYLFSKKIHRVLVLIITVIGVLMSITGVLLKYTFISTKFSFIDLGLIRFIHNNLSPFFVIIFFGMMITGIIMYLFPLVRNK